MFCLTVDPFQVHVKHVATNLTKHCLFQVMFSSVLNKRVPVEAGISIACVSPGVVDTNVVSILNSSQLLLVSAEGKKIRLGKLS